HTSLTRRKLRQAALPRCTTVPLDGLGSALYYRKTRPSPGWEIAQTPERDRALQRAQKVQDPLPIGRREVSESVYHRVGLRRWEWNIFFIILTGGRMR